MSLNRYAQRRDANEVELISAARGIGAQFERGPPLDGWCSYQGKWFPVEIKRPDGPQGGRKGRKYTADQLCFMDRCKTYGSPFQTWRTVDDVLASLNARQTA